MGMATGILFAVAGSSCPQAGAAFATIEQRARQRFPGLTLGWAMTSAGVRRKLAAQGRPADDVEAALARMREAGVSRLAVQPLHLVDGSEYSELATAVQTFAADPGRQNRVQLGRPLLESESDVGRTLDVLRHALSFEGDADEAMVLVAHGSEQPRAIAMLASAATACERRHARIFLGGMLGEPNMRHVVARCRAAGIKQVRLVPLFVAAGYAVRDEIAGQGVASWASQFTQTGIKCRPVIKGLGEYDEIVDIWLDRVDAMLTELARDGA